VDVLVLHRSISDQSEYGKVLPAQIDTLNKLASDAGSRPR
jgi:hypothetical protein